MELLDCFRDSRVRPQEIMGCCWVLGENKSFSFKHCLCNRDRCIMCTRDVTLWTWLEPPDVQWSEAASPEISWVIFTCECVSTHLSNWGEWASLDKSTQMRNHYLINSHQTSQWWNSASQKHLLQITFWLLNLWSVKLYNFSFAKVKTAFSYTHPPTNTVRQWKRS